MEEAVGVPSVQRRVISAVRPSSRSGDTGRPTIATPSRSPIGSLQTASFRPIANLSPITGRLWRWNLSTKALATMRVTGTTRSSGIAVLEFGLSLPPVGVWGHALLDPVLSAVARIRGPARPPLGIGEQTQDLHLVAPAHPRTRRPRPIALRPDNQDPPGPARFPDPRYLRPANGSDPRGRKASLGEHGRSLYFERLKPRRESASSSSAS